MGRRSQSAGKLTLISLDRLSASTEPANMTHANEINPRPRHFVAVLRKVVNVIRASEFLFDRRRINALFTRRQSPSENAEDPSVR